MDRRRTNQVTMWAAIVFLVFVLIAVLVIFLVPNGEPDAANTSSPANTKPAPSATPTEVAGIGCEAPPSDNRKVPADLRWEVSTVSGVTWPVSDTVGPTETTEGFASCFEHSPVGAALAAVAINFSTTDRTQLDVAKFYLADSPGRDYVLANTAPDAYSPIARQMQENGFSLVGFRVEQYDGDSASIRLVLRAPGSTTGYRGIPAPMVWADGDWKLKPLDNGSTGQPTDERDGDFTDWTAAGNG
ncbi:conserved exported hypothetical protein [Plantibacter sp. T3]|nr:conserved exported hypothetical protein [Plantibacter sp. T3]